MVKVRQTKTTTVDFFLTDTKRERQEKKGELTVKKGLVDIVDTGLKLGC